jgi:hypothetical protein
MTKISASLRLCVNPISRRPSVGVSGRTVPRTVLEHVGHVQPETGPSRLSFERGAKRLGEIGSSLRWSDGVCGFEGVL